MAHPKVIVNLYPVLPADDEADRAAKRPIGRNAEIYNRVLHDSVDIVKAADDLGVWACSTIEHHMHSEGYELAPNPGVVNAFWSQHVENARVGTLGYVAATRDPIRIAEEMAVNDHITKGKYFAGFARGYQARWTHILGQYVDAKATASDGSETDLENRELFEERVLQVLDCWKNETVAFDGKYYKAPYPYDTGVENFPAARVAQEMGAPGEIDEDGTTVRRVSVVPKPYQDPHPPVFVAVSASPDSIRFCSRNGFRPVYFTPLDHLVELANVYVDEGRQHGIDYQYGANQCIVRWPHFSKDDTPLPPTARRLRRRVLQEHLRLVLPVPDRRRRQRRGDDPAHGRYGHLHRRQPRRCDRPVEAHLRAHSGRVSVPDLALRHVRSRQSSKSWRPS